MQKTSDTIISYTYIATAIGNILLTSSKGKLLGLYIKGHNHFSKIEKDWVQDTALVFFKKVEQELAAYFYGNNPIFTLDYTLEGSDLERNVWKALLHIPYGMVVSYSTFTSFTAYPHAIRAVASAIGRNPLSILLPCHRVVSKDGSLGGYAAGLSIKKKLLAIEKRVM
ncbi:MAG: methylated-DNA--[protein]-cysteine S-methyltransferase [Amoebophilaceae bacterium]|nr:methylated-DNA--[protein]-cysteine S-methyltransferase [Amoebophilaceae bacterium]